MCCFEVGGLLVVAGLGVVEGLIARAGGAAAHGGGSVCWLVVVAVAERGRRSGERRREGTHPWFCLCPPALSPVGVCGVSV